MYIHLHTLCTHTHMYIHLPTLCTHFHKCTHNYDETSEDKIILPERGEMEVGDKYKKISLESLTPFNKN